MTIADVTQVVDNKSVEINKISSEEKAKIAITSYVDELIQQIVKSKEKFIGLANCLQEGYFSSLENRIKNEKEELDTELMCATTPSDIKFLVQNGFEKLHTISLEEWPLAYHLLKKQLKEVDERICYGKNGFRGFSDFGDVLGFEDYKERGEIALDKVKEGLKNAQTAQKANEITKKAFLDIQEVREDVELHIARFSILNTKEKILYRVLDIELDFDDLDYSEECAKVEEIAEETMRLIKNKTKKDQFAEIKKQLDKFQEVDMEIEKKYMIRSIQKEYEKLIKTATKLKSEDLSLSAEMKYATDRVEGSTERIHCIGNEFSPTGLDPVSQLRITQQGTLHTLARTLKEVFIKYGVHTVGNAINLLPFGAKLGCLEGIGQEEKNALKMIREKLVENAKEELTWGSNLEKARVPPIIPEEKITQIIDFHLDQASKVIYLSYAEQCIRKSLKFCMLRKSFDGLTEEGKVYLHRKAEKIIKAAKTELSEYLDEQSPPRLSMTEENAEVKGELTVDEMKVEAIISKYNQQLHAATLKVKLYQK